MDSVASHCFRDLLDLLYLFHLGDLFVLTPGTYHDLFGQEGPWLINCTYSICNTNGECDRQNLHIDSTGLYMLPGLWDSYITCISFVYHLYIPGHVWEWVCRGLGRMIRPTLDHARHQAAQSWEIPAITPPPWLPPLPPTCFLPSISSGRMIARGKHLPQDPPLLDTLLGSRTTHISYIYLFYFR